MGRPTLLSDEVEARLIEAFKIGQISIPSACHYAGISERTYYDWMKKGREGDPRYLQFSQDIEKARAEAVMVNLAVIRKAAQNGQWQAAAWWLERVLPKEYGRKTTVDVISRDALMAELERLEAELVLNDDQAGGS